MLVNNLLTVASLCLAFTAASPTKIKRCYGPVLAIYARGTDPSQSAAPPAPDPTATDALLASIATNGVPAATPTALSYPAAGIVDPSQYSISWGDGIDNLQGLVKYVVDTCPGTKIVLLGYSQGASVVTGAIGGGQGRPPLTGQYLDAIAGGVAIADPSYVAGIHPLDDHAQNQNINGGLPDPSGAKVQQNVSDFLGTRFAQFCENGDRYCANAGDADTTNIHGREESLVGGDAITFLQGLNIS